MKAEGFALLVLHCIGKCLLHGNILREVKVHLYKQCVVAVISAHMPGRFYVRSEVIHKSPPDYCIGKSLLHGKILRKNFDLT